ILILDNRVVAAARFEEAVQQDEFLVNQPRVIAIGLPFQAFEIVPRVTQEQYRPIGLEALAMDRQRIGRCNNDLGNDVAVDVEARRGIVVENVDQPQAVRPLREKEAESGRSTRLHAVDENPHRRSADKENSGGRAISQSSSISAVMKT